MGVLRFIWRGVLAFDRIGSRIPQLIQIWLVELFFALPLTFFIAKLIDIHGAFGVPGTGESIPGVFWGALVVSLVFGFRKGNVSAKAGVGDRVEAGADADGHGVCHRMYSIGLDVVSGEEDDRRLAPVTVGDTDSAGEYRRIEGPMLTDAVYWAPRGTGRGGNNYSGAGVLVELPSGGEALLLVESLSVPDFVGMMKDTKNRELKTQGKVIDSVTEDQEEYYGFDETAFPERSPDGRVLMLLSYP